MSWSDENTKWKFELPGKGHSSPVIWGDKVFVLAGSISGDQVSCVSVNLESGKKEWERTFQSQGYRVHSRSSFASSTPAVDENHVYFVFAYPEKISLIALTHEGKDVWTRDLGSWISQHGFGASPMVYRDKVIFANSQQAQRVPEGKEPGKSNLIALECATGKTSWSIPLAATRACYSIPCVIKNGQGKELLVNTNTGNGFYAVDPELGKMVWEKKAFGMRVVSSTLYFKDKVFGSCGSGGGGNYLSALHLGKHPDKLYSIRKSGNYVPTAIGYDHWVFMFGDRGVVSCIKESDGEVVWSKRIANGFSGSPICVSGKIYCSDESGVVHVLRATDKFGQLARNSLGEDSRATPAFAGERMVLRTNTKLICIGK